MGICESRYGKAAAECSGKKVYCDEVRTLLIGYAFFKIIRKVYKHT